MSAKDYIYGINFIVSDMIWIIDNGKLPFPNSASIYPDFGSFIWKISSKESELHISLIISTISLPTTYIIEIQVKDQTQKSINLINKGINTQERSSALEIIKKAITPPTTKIINS